MTAALIFFVVWSVAATACLVAAIRGGDRAHLGKDAAEAQRDEARQQCAGLVTALEQAERECERLRCWLRARNHPTDPDPMAVADAANAGPVPDSPDFIDWGKP